MPCLGHLKKVKAHVESTGDVEKMLDYAVYLCGANRECVNKREDKLTGLPICSSQTSGFCPMQKGVSQAYMDRQRVKRVVPT